MYYHNTHTGETSWEFPVIPPPHDDVVWPDRVVNVDAPVSSRNEPVLREARMAQEGEVGMSQLRGNQLHNNHTSTQEQEVEGDGQPPYQQPAVATTKI